jgi:hypothetical protein
MAQTILTHRLCELGWLNAVKNHFFEQIILHLEFYQDVLWWATCKTLICDLVHIFKKINLLRIH